MCAREWGTSQGSTANEGQQTFIYQTYDFLALCALPSCLFKSPKHTTHLTLALDRM